MVLTAQSEVRAFSFKFLSSVISTVSLYTVLIPWVTEGGGPVFKARQQERILSSFFCPSLQSSSEMTPKFAKIVPLEVTHLMLFGLSLSHAKAALLRACARTSPPRFSRPFAESPLLRPRLLRRLKKILVARVPPQHRAMIYHGIV